MGCGQAKAKILTGQFSEVINENNINPGLFQYYLILLRSHKTPIKKKVKKLRLMLNK